MFPSHRLEPYWFFERDWDSFEQLRDWFEWEVPEQFNMAEYLCDRWARTDGDRVAVVAKTDDGTTTHTYSELASRANRLANYLRDCGVERGDRIAMHGSQKTAILAAQIAAWKLGAATVPVSTMYGPEGLGYRLRDSSAVAFVEDPQRSDAFQSLDIDDLPDLETVLTVSKDNGGSELPGRDFATAIETASDTFETVATDAEEVAIIIYTSGTTGDPKGTVLPHRVLLGNLPAFLMTHCDMELHDDDLFWVPAEWSWIAVYMWVLCPMFYGRQTFAYLRPEFNPVEVYENFETYGITNCFIPPTAARMMMQHPSDEYDLDHVRLISSGGEAVGESIREWVAETFDDPSFNVAFGQTEANSLLGECSALGVSRPDSVGVPAPGYETTIVDPETAEPLDEPGVVGEIAARYEGNPLLFKEYWHKPDATERKVQNGWLLTEDLGTVDADGFYYYESRKDDVIISSGYRIGPEEVEEQLATHSAVTDAGVIGIPDETRGEIVKAFVLLVEDREPSESLAGELKQYVKDELAKYEYPREIEFVDALPKTVTGKIRRRDLREREGLVE